jgi:hypothetical protein
MFREKAVAIPPKKEDIAINVVFVTTTCNQILENVVFKEKEPHNNKSLANWQKEEKLQCLFE